MNKNYFKIFLIMFFIIFTHKSIHSSETKIIFKILSDSFTSVDYEKRKNYLKFIGDNKNLNKNEIIEDYISVSLFNKYYIDRNYNFDIQKRIKEIYNNILKENKKNTEFNENNFNKNNIIKNLELDLIRKNILEEFLNTKRDEIFSKEEEINILYNYEITYINVYKKDLKLINNEITNLEFSSIEMIESFLKSKKIEYFKKNKQIQNINSINDKLKKKYNFK